LANVAYLVTLPLQANAAALAANPNITDPIARGIQHAASDRVASATADVIFPGLGATIMAAAIMVSTFGCNNGLILAGARAYWAMARDGLFFRPSGHLNDKHVPAWGLVIQGIWAALLVLPRVVTGTDKATGAPTYGSLYNDLLTYVISAALIFYILTIAGVFVLRHRRPNEERPYRAFGYPFVPALYIAGASVILILLFAYRTSTTVPGLVIVMIGLPVYFFLKRRA
jgi:APA family basic amino acid/polyamine antiporter